MLKRRETVQELPGYHEYLILQRTRGTEAREKAS